MDNVDVDVPVEVDDSFLLGSDGKDSDGTLHEYILHYDDKEITVNVDQKTAYLLSNDHSYAEEYMSALTESEDQAKTPDESNAEYLDEVAVSLDGTPVIVGRKSGGSKTAKTKSNAGGGEGFWSWTYHSTEIFINARIKMEDKFQNPDYITSTLWIHLAEELNLATSMQFTAEACNHKWRNMIATYKVNLKKAQDTGHNPSWPFYDVFYEAYGEEQITPRLPSNPHSATPSRSSAKRSLNESESVKKLTAKNMSKSEVTKLLCTRLGMESLFAEPDSNADDLWDIVVQEVNLDPSICSNPAQICKDRWILMINKYKQKLNPDYPEEEQVLWPFFKQFHEVYNGEVPEQYLIEEIRDGGMWTMTRVKQLLQLRIDMNESFTMPKAKKQQLWTKIADELNEMFPEICVNAMECDEKYRSCLKSYRSNLKRLHEKGYVNWPYFQMIHDAYGESAEEYMARRSSQQSSKPRPPPSKLWSGKNVELLIKCRLEMEGSFVHRKCKMSSLWCTIAKNLNNITKSTAFSWSTCLGKWRKLKINYDYIIEKSVKTGVIDTVWPYFKLFHNMYGLGKEGTSATQVIDISYVDDTVNSGEDTSFGDQSEPVGNSLSPTKRIPPILLRNRPHKQDSPSKTDANQQDRNFSSLNRGAPVRIASSSRLANVVQPSTSSNAHGLHTKNQGLQNDVGMNYSSRLPVSTPNETLWLKDAMLDWKKERRLRWEEKKKLEKEKIQAINNLTQAILSLERRDPPLSNTEDVLKSNKSCDTVILGSKRQKLSEEI